MLVRSCRQSAQAQQDRENLYFVYTRETPLGRGAIKAALAGDTWCSCKQVVELVSGQVMEKAMQGTRQLFFFEV